MKTLKFAEKLVPLVISGEKTATWRMFDDKDLKTGDELTFINQATGQEFAVALILSVKETPLGEIKDDDFVGHEKFAGREEMFENYRSYYGGQVTENTVVKMVSFKIVKRL
jgi:hypothetical protein